MILLDSYSIEGNIHYRIGLPDGKTFWITNVDGSGLFTCGGTLQHRLGINRREASRLEKNAIGFINHEIKKENDVANKCKAMVHKKSS